jgi:CzcA family heavy metal efflux pump
VRVIVESSLRFRGLVIGLASGLVLFGVFQLRSMPVDVLPEFVPPYVEVQTEALGLSAAEVEQLITVPLEADLLAGVAWLDRMESQSVPGLSSVVMYFKPGTDLLRARQVVAERLTQAPGLPHVSKPPAMLQPLSSNNRLMMIGLSSKDLPLIDMSVLARWTVRPRLLGVPGVANVSIWGQRERQLQVQVDPAKLRDKGVSLLQVITTTGNALWVSPLSFLEASTPGTGGFIDNSNQRLGIQHILPISSAADLAKVPVEPVDPASGPVPGAPRLGDVATVVEDHQPLIGDAVINGGAGLLLVIEKFPGANTLEVTRGVTDALDALRPGLADVDIDPSVFRPATFIEQAESNLTLALLIAFVLVALALGALLFDWRAGLVGLVAIPVSLVAAALVLFVLGATLNIMIVAGLVIALAIVIDDAVVGTDNVLRRLEKPQDGDAGRSAAAIVIEASLEVRRSLVYATVIIAVTLVPLLFIGGPSGAFLPHVALAYLAAILASMVVALTITPALGFILFSRWPSARHASPLVRRLQHRYHWWLARIADKRRTVLAVAGIVALAGLLILPVSAAAIIPTFQDRDLLIHWDGAPGTSLPEMSRIVARASNELQAIPGVRSVGGHVGRAIASDQVVGSNSGELWVGIDPAADYDATFAAIKGVVKGYPGLRHTISTFPNDRISQVLSGSTNDLVVRVYGEDLDVLRSKAAEVSKVMAGIEGVTDAAVDSPVDEPTLEVQVDLVKAQEHGIKAGDVRRAAATLLSGLQVGSLFEDQKVFEVVVWGIPEIRHSLSSIRDLLIETPTGGYVRLGDVADVRVASSPSSIKREGVARRIDIGANVRGRDLEAVARDVQAAIARVEFPLEHHAELLGGYAEKLALREQVIAFAAAAAILVFLLLQAAFGSWRLAAMVFLTLPAALAGGLLVAVAAGGVISLGSIAGFIAVFGLAARSAILLVSQYQRLEREEGESSGAPLVLRGAREQLGPTLTAAVAIGLAVLPFVILGDRAGLEMAHPMALVILGGLITSTLINLFVIPVLYLRSGPSPEADTSASSFVEQPGLSPA